MKDILDIRDAHKSGLDSSNRIFGTTTGGGMYGGGTLYKLTGAAHHNESVQYSFCATGGTSCTDGWNPQGGLIMDSAGILYRTTFGGGSAGNNGTVYQLTP